MSSGSWVVERVRGGAGTLHARGVPAVPFVRTVEILEVDRPALVLGSTQPDSVADVAGCAAAGVDIARRRSGGGVVLVGAEECIWVDVLLPAVDPLWDDDVSRSTRWLGAVWAEAVTTAWPDVAPVVHEGAMCLTRWGRLVCFAGLGPGEVTDGEGGPKIVGISQRRGRHGARFQCAVPLRWDGQRLSSMLAFSSAGEREEAARDLGGPGIARPLPPPLASALVDTFLERLPASSVSSA